MKIVLHGKAGEIFLPEFIKTCLYVSNTVFPTSNITLSKHNWPLNVAAPFPSQASKVELSVCKSSIIENEVVNLSV